MLNLIRTLLPSVAMLCALSISAQDAPLYGTWHGKMKTANGARYVFSLDILPERDGGWGSLKAVAIHNRNGDQEVIELTGIIYADKSIYLSDVIDRYEALKDGRRVSKLQFLLKYKDGNYHLDGHWQEYRDLRRYRKGRLFLRKLQSKA